jgi:hypothetical protein
VVEKDYVLAWLLAATSQHAVIRGHWILKGSTCVKKCFFETYRFSEDLDYSLLPTTPYDAASIPSPARLPSLALPTRPNSLYSPAVFPNHAIAPGTLFHNEIAVHEYSIASESSPNPYDVGSTSGTCFVPIR